MASVSSFLVGAVVGYILAKPEVLDKFKGSKKEETKGDKQ